METLDPLLERIAPVLAAVPGVLAVVLGGSRASGASHSASDYDIGLFFTESAGLDVGPLLEAVKDQVDDPHAASITEVGGWGQWIVGGGWLTIAGKKVDLLYRPVESVEKVIRNCRDGRVSIDYQPGHPHGFCSAIWMGEVALCHVLHDPRGVIAGLKATTAPYPDKLQEALIRRFRWEALFSIENAETAVPRGDQTYVAGSAFRSLACVAIEAAARLPLTISDLSERTASVWRAVGLHAFGAALAELRSIERELARLTAATA